METDLDGNHFNTWKETVWKELNVDTNDIDPSSSLLPRISIEPSPANRLAKLPKPHHAKKLTKVEAQIRNSNGKMLDPNKYFGAQARKDFFSNYQDMNKNRMMYSGSERLIEKSLESNGVNRLSLIPKGPLPPITSVGSSVDAVITSIDAFDPRKSQNLWGENDAFAEYDDEKLRKSTKNFYGSRSSVASVTSLMASTDLISSNHEVTAATAVDNYTDEFSPRTKYIGACIRDHIMPLPKMIVRKDEDTTFINLSHYGIQDSVGKILSEYLDDLPYVESIDISGNNLTDESLPLLFKSFQKIPNLKYLNLSRSKIDNETSDALAEFLANPHCPLHSLVLQNADIDDFECARFIGCLKTNKHLKELDLSSNLLGSAEIFQGAKSSSFTAGGKAIAEFIASSDCRLHALNLGWNNIKMASSIDIAKSLSLNHTLTYLDLSFNGLGQQAGEYLGESLQVNKTLHTLLLDSNQLNGAAVFCICVGLQNNESIRKLSLDKNPIGEFGARAIIQVPEYVGKRTSLSAIGCNTKLRENNLILNFRELVKDYTLNLERPFERTVARWLLEKVAGHSSYHFSKVSYQTTSTSKEQPINLVLTSIDEETSYEMMDENSKHCVDGLRQLLKASEDTEQAERVFLEADSDCNGVLDRDELQLCLETLGYPVESETVDDIFFEFDVDFSGTLQRDEFFHFLHSKVEESKSRIKEALERYHYSLATAPDEVYVPPKTGILRLYVSTNYTDKGSRNVVTSVQQLYACEKSSAIGDSNLIVDFIHHSRLRYNEALKFYKVLNAETGKMFDVCDITITYILF